MTSWQLAKEKPERISAIATTSGVTNSRVWADNRPGIKNNISLIDGYDDDSEKVYDSLSPVRWVEYAAKAPVLIIHSRDDDKVSVIHSLQMAQELTKLDRVFRMKIYEDGGHSLLGHKTDSTNELISWFSRYLK